MNRSGKRPAILLAVPRMNIGGSETYVFTVALGLKKLGYEVHIASAGGQLIKPLQEQGIKHHFVPIRLNASLAAYMLRKIIQHENISLIHANSAAAGIAAVKAKRKCHIPLIYTAHGVFGHTPKELTLNECDKIICVSEFVKKYAIEKGFSPEKLQVAYTGIDLQKFQSDVDQGRLLRQQLNIPQDAFTLALVARIKNLTNKGHADMLQVFEEHAAAKKWHLIVIGKGQGLGKLQSLIKQKNMPAQIHCVGHQTNVAAYLNAVDAVVLPSQLETFGLVLAEGMAMAKPAIAYDVGGTSEVIIEAKTGFLVPLHDTKVLYQKIKELADDREFCRQMGYQGRKYVEAHFSCQQMIDELQLIYKPFIKD